MNIYEQIWLFKVYNSGIKNYSRQRIKIGFIDNIKQNALSVDDLADDNSSLPSITYIEIVNI